MNRRGFTLIEMMVVLVIAGFMVLIALPNFRLWVSSQRLRSSASQIEGDLQVARMTAINRNAPVTVRFGTPSATEYIGFVDDGAGGGTARDLQRNGGEELLFQRALEPQVTMAPAFGAEPAVLFDGRGLRGSPRSGSAQLTLRNEDGRQYLIAVTVVGDVNVTQ